MSGPDGHPGPGDDDEDADENASDERAPDEDAPDGEAADETSEEASGSSEPATEPPGADDGETVDEPPEPGDDPEQDAGATAPAEAPGDSGDTGDGDADAGGEAAAGDADAEGPDGGGSDGAGPDGDGSGPPEGMSVREDGVLSVDPPESVTSGEPPGAAFAEPGGTDETESGESADGDGADGDGADGETGDDAPGAEHSPGGGPEAPAAADTPGDVDAPAGSRDAGDHGEGVHDPGHGTVHGPAESDDADVVTAEGEPGVDGAAVAEEAGAPTAIGEDEEAMEPPSAPEPDLGGGLGGPAEDQEMPLEEHVEEMIRRLGAVVVIAGLVSASLFVTGIGDDVINFLWYSVLPVTEEARPHLYLPAELVLTEFKVASLAGVVIALPVLVYQSYRFMRPGLYPHERRYYLAAVPTSLILAFVGITFAYFIVLPVIFTYFLQYTEGTAAVAFALGQTVDLMLVIMGFLAVVFQIPLFVMLALMMGLVTRQWLVQRRLLFWGAFAGISFLFSPDPTGMAPIIIALTMIVLFEGSLVLARWTNTGG